MHSVAMCTYTSDGDDYTNTNTNHVQKGHADNILVERLSTSSLSTKGGTYHGTTLSYALAKH